MITPSRLLKFALVFLALLSAHGACSGQSLYDVVISLSDRQRVVIQRNQVAVYLQNENNDPADTDQTIPGDQPIDWQGVGTNPTQGTVDGLNIAGKISLLNQAVAEFDRLKIIFLNSSPDEFNSGSTVGAIKPYLSADFDSLPRATPENHQRLLWELSQRVRALRLIDWPSAFVVKNFTGQTHVWEEIHHHDPVDTHQDGNLEPYVKICTDPGVTAPESVDWSLPGSIGPGNLDVHIDDPLAVVSSTFDSQIHVYGSYSERASDVSAITQPIHKKKIGLSGGYPGEAKLSATAPGAAGTQIGGNVYIIRRSHWHQIDITGVSSQYGKNEAGWVVGGSGDSGSAPLLGMPPTATFEGSWMETNVSISGAVDWPCQIFVEDGYKYKKSSFLNADDQGYSDNHGNSYEQNWKIGCVFQPVFKPTFTRGVDADTMRTKLESTDGILAVNSADGQLVTTVTSGTLNPFNDAIPVDWVVASAGKTITGSATLGTNTDRATRYGKLPTSLSIQYGGIQPDATYAWDTHGLLSSFVQGPWSTVGAVDAGAFKQTHQLNNSTVSTDWTELLDGGEKVKTHTTPDGTVTSKTDTSVAWSEVEYGNATVGLPGLPHIVRNSGGTGATYGWNADASGAYILTLEKGLLSGSAVSRGTKVIRDINARGHPNKIGSSITGGGSLETGGTVFSNFTAWAIPKTSTDDMTGLASTWDYSNALSRLSTHTGPLGVVAGFSGYDVLGRPATVSHNGISAATTYNAFSTTSAITGGATGNLEETRDALGQLTSSNTTWNGVTDDLTITPGSTTGSTTGITRSHTLLGTHTATLRRDDGTLAASAGPTQPFGGTAGTALTVDNGLLKSTSNLGDQAAAYQTTWTDAWGRLRKTTTANGTTHFLHTDASSSLQRVRITEPNGRKTITESDPYNSAGAITRSGIDVDRNGVLGATDRYVESITTISNSDRVTTLKLTEDGGLREILRTTWTPDGNETVTKINGNEETITRTPNYGTKTVKTESMYGLAKRWEKNESFNNLGLR